MADPSIPEQLVAAVIANFPDHKAGTRPIHTIGIGVKGHFIAAKLAREYCTAAHFQGEQVDVTVRFSNGSGSPVQHDGWSDVRGMAVRFHLASGMATDLISMTLREFFSPTVADFLAFTKASNMQPVTRQSPWKKIGDMLHLKPPLPDPMPGQTMSNAPGALAYANRSRPAQLAVFDAGSIGAPVSYLRATYSAVHTFVVVAPDGTRRQVRFQWQPVMGTETTDPNPDDKPCDDYLQGRLRQSLGYWPVQFLLLMTIGETGDAFDDPTTPWLPKRVRVVLGTLTLAEVANDQDADCEKISFNPCRLTPGLELSDDPILAARKDSYEVSRIQRGGTACPFDLSVHTGALARRPPSWLI